MITRAALKREIEDLSDESSLKKIEESTAKLATHKDFVSKTNRLKIPNKKILQTFLSISIDNDLDEFDQVELLETLNALNEL